MSNDHGGILILGLDEERGFTPAPGFDASRVRNAVADACNNDLHPPVRAEIDIVEFGGTLAVVAEVEELDPRFKPCYVKALGEYNGSFTRGGDGDRRLTDFERYICCTPIAANPPTIVSRYQMPPRRTLIPPKSRCSSPESAGDSLERSPAYPTNRSSEG